MPGGVNCIFTKVLIPFVEREVGPEGVAAILRTAGRSRDYLVADHNWLSLPVANELVRLAMELMGETDEDRWARRYSEYLMEWRPSRADRHYLGTYSMGLGEPRRYFERCHTIWGNNTSSFMRMELVDIGRRRARYRLTPEAGVTMPRWVCTWIKVGCERATTVWGLRPTIVTESECSAAGAPACSIDVRWTNPPLGPLFWAPTAAGVVGGAAVASLLATQSMPLAVDVAAGVLAVLAGLSGGLALRERARRRQAQRLLDLQSEEIIYSNKELEKKFRDLEDKIEQLSLLIDLSAAVNATLDPEKIYEQAVQRLVHRMGYQSAQFFLVDHGRRVVRGHK